MGAVDQVDTVDRVDGSRRGHVRFVHHFHLVHRPQSPVFCPTYSQTFWSRPLNCKLFFVEFPNLIRGMTVPNEPDLRSQRQPLLAQGPTQAQLSEWYTMR